MRAAGVHPIVESESLSVVGLVEVLRHIPRIYREFRKLVRAARQRHPDLAILTDSPDFHLRLARKLHNAGIPVVKVPFTVGGTDGAKDLFGLFDDTLARLLAAGGKP